VLGRLHQIGGELKRERRAKTVVVTTTPGFAGLWLIPRLANFTREHPGVDVRITADVRVQDLERDGLDIALRHGPSALAGPNAIRLFGEKVFPVCSPKLLKKVPLAKPADLRHHVLLHYDDPDVRHPWLHWKTWLEVEHIADLKPAGTWIGGRLVAGPLAAQGN
jgi:DNA-binding transcriptional LysR family regulator